MVFSREEQKFTFTEDKLRRNLISETIGSGKQSISQEIIQISHNSYWSIPMIMEC